MKNNFPISGFEDDVFFNFIAFSTLNDVDSLVFFIEKLSMWYFLLSRDVHEIMSPGKWSRQCIVNLTFNIWVWKKCM